MKLLMLKGLPASGKSTFAKGLASSGYVRINKDDLRAMLHSSKWTKENEKQILRLRDAIIEDTLSSGKSVVVDDTNLAPKHEARLKELAKKHSATFETKFFDVPVEECIKRDLGRLNSVGKDVIIGMYNQFLRPPAKSPVWDSTLPTAILCDIDGTLAHMDNRSPYDWAKVGEDTLDASVASILHHYSIRNPQDEADIQVILLSGRDAICRPQTEGWLQKHGIRYDLLLMRPQDDNRKDYIVKRELYDGNIEGKYNVLFVLDDRDQVVNMWRNELGLKCFQVAEGNF